MQVTLLESNQLIHKFIVQYAENSHGLKPKKGKTNLMVGNILMCEPKQAPQPESKTGLGIGASMKKVGRTIAAAIGGGQSSSSTARIKTSNYSMLLWYWAPSSALGSIVTNGLKLRPSGLLVFYDRLSRALSKWDTPEHGHLLLCEVSLGSVYKSPHGVGFWASAAANGKANTKGSRKIPHGYDTVKGTGAFMPDWSRNQTWQGAIVPSGATVRNPRYPSYELDYNEYIICDESKARVKFVVELNTK